MISSITGNLDESLGALRKSGGPTPGVRAVPADSIGRERARDVWMIEVDRIAPDPDQPRKEFDPEALDRLAESIRTRGQLQPIQVRWNAELERFVILMGERRWRASQLAGLKSLACVVRDREIDDAEKLSIQLVENCLREDLSPVDQAKAFRSLMQSQGWSQDRVASELAISQASVAKALSILRLPETVQARVDSGDLAASVAYEIAKLDDPAAQVRLATEAAEQGFTREDVVKQVRRAPSKKKAPAAKKLPPARVWRIDGFRVEVGRKAGVDPAAALAAVEEVAARLRAELGGSQAEAA